jgi:hypothetical protein
VANASKWRKKMEIKIDEKIYQLIKRGCLLEAIKELRDLNPHLSLMEATELIAGSNWSEITLTPTENENVFKTAN